jgi:predicted RNase H-like nuclease
MRAVLGIDAAWTNTQPSGVAVAMDTGEGWRLAAIAPSYSHFHALAHGNVIANSRPSGSEPHVLELLGSATALCGSPPDLVAIDMPLSRKPISCRRASDDAVSRAYGSRHCSTHTPSTTRPGRISDDLTQTFGTAGYPLLTSVPPRPPGLVEVYPHPALVEFTRAPMRLKYKAGKARAYWPGHTPTERRGFLFQQWKIVMAVLDARLPGVLDALPAPRSDAIGFELKAYEDMLDAVVCACVAICVLEGEALPYGDDSSAIWIPQPPNATPALLS